MADNRFALPGIGHNGGGCRLCERDDYNALIEHVAQGLGQSREPDGGWSWETAGDHWHRIFRQLAETALNALRSS
jgi:hypothetical protein